MSRPHLFPTAELPEWFKTCAADSFVTAKELLKIYNVSQSTLRGWLKNGTFPQADILRKCHSGEHHKATLQWRIDTIRKFAERV